MKILVISLQVPHPYTRGSSLCFYNLFKRLGSRHELHLVAFERSGEDRAKTADFDSFFAGIDLVPYEELGRPALRHLKNMLSWNSGFLLREQQPALYSRLRAKILEIISRREIDIVHFHLLDAVEFLEKAPSPPRVLHAVDSRSLAIKRRMAVAGRGGAGGLAERLWYRRVRSYERRVLGDVDATVTVGKRDFEFLKNLAPGARVHHVPLGVDTDYFEPRDESGGDAPSVIFTGTMSFPPNIDAVLHFHERILPRIRDRIPEVRFVVAGSSPPREITELASEKGVEVTGYVDDLRPYVAQATIAVCPMRMGGGMKIKILEAMAMGKTIVSTSLGAEGIDAADGENIILADGEDEFAGAVVKALGDPSLRKRVGTEARKLVETGYSWDACARRHEEIYLSLIEDGGRHEA
jgi:glycosyltransferase involved in cell wall biosynthesis